LISDCLIFVLCVNAARLKLGFAVDQLDTLTVYGELIFNSFCYVSIYIRRFWETEESRIPIPLPLKWAGDTNVDVHLKFLPVWCICAWYCDV